MKSRKEKTENKRKRAGGFLIVAGVLCLAVATGLVLYNVWDSYRAGEESARIEEALIEKISDNMKATDTPSDPAAGTGSADDSLLQTVPMDDLEETPYRDMPTEEVEGYSYIGFLEIPSINLSLPVMETWDYNRLKISPCRYSGSYYTDDLVICAHNYYRHFTPVKDSLGMGQDVYFTNVEGESIHYKTVNKETVQPTDIATMVSNDRNSGNRNEWDLTLFTCNLGGQTRAAIRCQRVQPER